MVDDGAFSPAGEGSSGTIGIQLTMEGGSGNRGELLEDDDEEEFEMETDDLDDESDQVLGIKSNGLENVTELVPGVERNDLENDGEQVLDIDSADLENDSEQVLEFESNEHESNSDQLLEIPSNYHDSNSDQMLEIPGKEYENDKDAHIANVDDQIDGSKGKFYLPPVVGMEFESYDDAYNYYNSYAKEVGFGIRVKSSWTKRNSKEKRGAVLCCNCEGFKTMKEANARRKETRTGCLAMIRLRLVESNRWRLDEVKLEHNHLFDPERAQNSKSHKKIDSGAKRKLESAVDVELSEVYTKDIFLKFQDEVERMSNCFSVTQIHANQPVITYIVKEQDPKGDSRNFEVIYDKVGAEVRCICSCFNFRGYLCRHALCVLNYNAVDEVPSHYILSRWRKDLKRLYAPDLGSNNIDITNPVQWFDHLHRRAVQVVAEGMTSQDHHMVAWQAFKESLNKVRLVADKHV
ncbi:unnamed protein product [Fraxinus pennsylvanica]|uniref:Protein FAR1-RELATED SEQUENCE n=1 Tax=Fraxinus pennsylvanica TaxID=56036 RepID=A0AAD1ZFP1_9LAMI|nr:unnamed protein product [Fraxinus pennsylvanica]